MRICLSCKKNTANKSSSLKKSKQNRLMLIPNCSIGGKKKLRLIIHQEASGLLRKLEIRIPLNNIPLIDDILF